MNRSILRQWGRLTALWLLIAAVPIGRSLLNDQFPFQIGFNLIVLFSGLVLAPFLILWFNYLSTRNVSWFWIAIIQISFAILVSMWFYYAVQEHPGIVKGRTSQDEVAQMGIVQKIGFYLFSGNSYSIFTSLTMLSGFGLVIAYSEQIRRRKLRYEEFERNYLRNRGVITDQAEPPNYPAPDIQPRKIAVKTGKKYNLIDPGEIIYISADGNYCDITLKSEEHFLHRITITELFSTLPPDKFMRIHQSYVISLDAVNQVRRLSFGELEVVMENEHHLKVSRKYKKQVAELIRH